MASHGKQPYTRYVYWTDFAFSTYIFKAWKTLENIFMLQNIIIIMCTYEALNEELQTVYFKVEKLTNLQVDDTLQQHFNAVNQ